MSETLQSKLCRLLQDEHIYRVEINIKCKTKDGMIYTMQSTEYDRADSNVGCLPFDACVDTGATKELLHVMDVVEKGDGFWFSVEEMAAIKHTEIIRIWAELGDLYHDEMPEN